MTNEVINTAVGFRCSREAAQMAHLYRKKRAVEKIGLAHVVGLVVELLFCPNLLHLPPKFHSVFNFMVRGVKV